MIADIISRFLCIPVVEDALLFCAAHTMQKVETSMATTTNAFRQAFHDDDGTNLLLTCDDGSCLVEFCMPNERETPVRVELLIQPRDARGLPAGPPVELYSRGVPLYDLPGGRGRLGRFWLPNDLADRVTRHCFFRLTPMPPSGATS